VQMAEQVHDSIVFWEWQNVFSALDSYTCVTCLRRVFRRANVRTCSRQIHVCPRRVFRRANSRTCSRLVSRACVLGCNNGITRFHETLVTFKHQKLPDFLWAQKMRLEKCSP